MTICLRRFLMIGAMLVVALTSRVFADPPGTRPAEGLRENTPTTHVFRGARIIDRPGHVIENAVLIIRDGVITGLGEGLASPADARVWDLTGKTIYAGLIDAFSDLEISKEALKGGAPAWNGQIRPQLRIAEHYRFDSSLNEKLRSQGITARLVAPRGGILKGQSALVSTEDAGNSRSILAADVAQHLRLTVPPGRGRDNYPNSPMGAVALARQTFYDAQWYREAWEVYRNDRRVTRPERNDALIALGASLQRRGLLIVDAPNELFVLRADRFAREFALQIAIRGSGYEYRQLDPIRKTGRTVIVPVRFPKPPNVGSIEAALNVDLEDLMHWDLAAENPGRLVRAGVKIALTTDGLSDPQTFLSGVRRAVERGLPADEALKAMTTTPAALLAVADRLGTLASGKTASFVVTDGDLFDANSKVLETWVEGRRHVVTNDDVLDWRGTWQLDMPGAGKPGWLLVLAGEAAKLKGTLQQEATATEDRQVKLVKVGVRDARFGCSFDANRWKRTGVARLSAVAESEGRRVTSWMGHVVWPDGRRLAVQARRAEKAAVPPSRPERKTSVAIAGDEAKAAINSASCEVNYPLGAFGRSGLPARPVVLALTGARIWTCGKAGVLQNATLIVREGRIVAVGSDLKAPADALSIDVGGRHITPGIIDCHSHMATDGGINESTQAITAEVRIGDFINSDDINIYRQLAGGVTCSNILHGSANPIGGQNQVIKLRWGQVPEMLKMREAPEGIKFALGENVKQSNWGEQYRTRYPQTRMGVEQIMRDALHAARDYRKRWESWQQEHHGLPPRRDLELDAVAEILEGKRWIHCHSYRQDEILALMRTLDDFKIRIGTFQHILEGYKVADAMARHGAMGSAFSDWWAYKFEVYDAIPYNGALMHQAGVVVSFNSDDRELARHLNHEAAKAVKYGGVSEVEALKFVTLNPARQLRIDKFVGSLETGKHADFVIWSGSPLSNFSRCEQTWIDGRKYFDRDEDRQLREKQRKIRHTLIQKILTSGLAMRKVGERDRDHAELWPSEDLFCHHHGDGHGHDSDHDHQGHQDH